MRSTRSFLSGLFVGALLISAPAGAGAEDCTVVFALDDAVTASSLQFEVGYPSPQVVVDGVGDDVECHGLVGGAFASFFDDDAAGVLDAAFIALDGFDGPADVLSCDVSADGVPSAADFAITVTDAADPDVEPIVPMPAVVVAEIQCEGVEPPTTTTTTVSQEPTTTSLPEETTTTTLPGDGHPCDVVFSLVDAVTVGSLQWTTSYANAAGEFVGSGEEVACGAASSGAFASFQDSDAQRWVESAIISIGGISGPAVLSSCTFIADSVDPLPSDFAVTVSDAATPDVEPIVPMPTVAVSVECGPDETTSTTTTSTTSTTVPAPICGDGVVDAGEDCDDANDSNSDDCLNDCTAAVCGDGIVNVGVEECDDGAANSDSAPDACRSDCTEPICGDGVADSGEECDAGAANSDADPEVCRTTCENDYVCGDADGNGSVSVLDAQFALQAGIGLASGCPIASCDVNGDGNVSVVDAQRILSQGVGLSSDVACGLRLRLSVDDAVTLGSLQVAIDYAATGQAFLGAGGSVDCTNLVGSGSFAAFNNDVVSSVLSVGLISTAGFTGPTDVVECRFRAIDELPDLGAFSLTVVDAADAGGLPLATPTVSLSY